MEATSAFAVPESLPQPQCAAVSSCTTYLRPPALNPQLLITTITDHGGDVLRLAGDALIVAFTGDVLHLHSTLAPSPRRSTRRFMTKNKSYPV